MMNTILLAFAIVITLINLAIALSTLGYVVEMNKYMEEWFKTFKTLTEACSKLCDGNGNIITSLMNHIEYTEKKFAEKKKEVQELNDKYDKLYEEFKNLKEELDESTYHCIKDALNNESTEDYHKYVLKNPFWITDTDRDIFRVRLKEGSRDEIEEIEEEDIGGQND